MKTLFNYFLRGLLFVLPVFATFYIIIVLVNWADETLNNILFDWLPSHVPGLGLIAAFFIIVFIGFAVTWAISKPVFSYFEDLISRTPIIKIIYTAFKDFTEAFFGKKKKFDKPVLITFTEGIDRIGFITEKDLSHLHIENRVAVYCPHSYNFSGNLFLVSHDRVRPLEIAASDALKFAVSAGVTKIENQTSV